MKRKEIISLLMAALFSLSLFMLGGLNFSALADNKEVVSDLPVRLHLIFKDYYDGTAIKDVKISGSYTYKYYDKDDNVTASVKGITPFDDVANPSPVSDKNGEIIFDMNGFGNVIHYKNGSYSGVTVGFKVVSPSGYKENTNSYSYVASYKTCKEVKDANGKVVGYELYKTIKLKNETASYPGRIKFTFKDKDGNPVPYVGISGNYGYHICDKDGNTTLTANGIAIIKDSFNDTYYSNSSGVVTVLIDAMGNIERTEKGAYSVVDFHGMIDYPPNFTFVKSSKNYSQISYKNCVITTDKDGKTYYECRVTVTLDGPKYETYSYPTKVNLLFKDQYGHPVKDVHIDGCAYGTKIVNPVTKLEMIGGGAIMPLKKTSVMNSPLTSDANGKITLSIKSSASNGASNISYDSWGGHTDLAIVVAYVAPDDYVVDYPYVDLGSESFDGAAVAMQGWFSYKDFEDIVNKETGEHTFEKTIIITLQSKATPKPTNSPTPKPTATPTVKPTTAPTKAPTAKPTATTKATVKPTAKPTTVPAATIKPIATATAKTTIAPIATTAPIQQPTMVPSSIDVDIDESPVPAETEVPTEIPTEEPTMEPTTQPTEEPMAELTAEPVPEASAIATELPAVIPSDRNPVEDVQNPTPSSSKEQAGGNIGIIIGVGCAVLVIAAGALILIKRKR